MGTLQQGVESVRRKVGFPVRPDAAGGLIAEFYLEVVDQKVTDLNQTREPWYVGAFNVTVSPNNGKYQLDNLATYFGKPRMVYTINSSDANHHRREVPIVTLEDLTGYHGGGDPAHTTGLSHTAEAVAFYYDTGLAANVMEFGPIPAETAQYRVLYEPSVVRAQAKTSRPFRFDQFDWYIAVCTAVRILPFCEWGSDAAENRARRAELSPYLMQEKAEGDDQYRIWKWSMTNPQTEKAIGFGQHRWRR